MAIQFVTGNKNKLKEFETVLGISLEQLDINLPEIQDIDAHAIVRHKLQAARGHTLGEYLIEDSSLYLDCLGGKLPGPLVKWFEKVMGNDGLAELVERYDNDRAEGRTLIGYMDISGQAYFFEGVLRGAIVRPRGNQDFGYGPVFQPEGYSKTFGEMSREEKHQISSRAQALRKLKIFLDTRNTLSGGVTHR